MPVLKRLVAEPKRLRWPILSAIAVAILCLYPQFLMWSVRGVEWHGAYAEIQGDEWLYSAYIQALIDGRPRRNDPYTGRDDGPQGIQPESLFSIQFVPAYLIATPARLLGMSASSAFIVLGVISPFLACLAIAWLLIKVSNDYRFSAAAAVLVIAFGGLAAGTGLIACCGSVRYYIFLPFLRRYEPAAMFPLFFVFCGLVWNSLANEGRRAVIWAIAAGLVIDVLIFSYVYLWTTALAWLAGLVLVWLVARPKDRWRTLRSLVPIGLIAAPAIILYTILLSHRSPTMDSFLQLSVSHKPDLIRIPELIGLGALILVAFAAVRGILGWRQPEVLFALSFALTPLIVFNQQVITGHSLQPFHFEWFITNYAALTGAVISVFLIWRATKQPETLLKGRTAARLIVIGIWWAAIEVLLNTNVILRQSQFTDRAAAVCQRLSDLPLPAESSMAGLDPRPLVFAADDELAIVLPTFAPQALLWSPNFDLLNLQPGESKDRFYKYLYYKGIDGNEYEMALIDPSNIFSKVAFGPGLNVPDVLPKPITKQQISTKVAEYDEFCLSFTREKASTHMLSYIIEPAVDADFTNVDRWYQRDQGETIGPYVLFRVRLR